MKTKLQISKNYNIQNDKIINYNCCNFCGSNLIIGKYIITHPANGCVLQNLTFTNNKNNLIQWNKVFKKLNNINIRSYTDLYKLVKVYCVNKKYLCDLCTNKRHCELYGHQNQAPDTSKNFNFDFNSLTIFLKLQTKEELNVIENCLMELGYLNKICSNYRGE